MKLCYHDQSSIYNSKIKLIRKSKNHPMNKNPKVVIQVMGTLGLSKNILDYFFYFFYY
jgi:hypothetical protein